MGCRWCDFDDCPSYGDEDGELIPEPEPEP